MCDRTYEIEYLVKATTYPGTPIIFIPIDPFPLLSIRENHYTV